MNSLDLCKYATVRRGCALNMCVASKLEHQKKKKKKVNKKLKRQNVFHRVFVLMSCGWYSVV